MSSEVGELEKRSERKEGSAAEPPQESCQVFVLLAVN